MARIDSLWPLGNSSCGASQAAENVFRDGMIQTCLLASLEHRGD